MVHSTTDDGNRIRGCGWLLWRGSILSMLAGMKPKTRKPNEYTHPGLNCQSKLSADRWAPRLGRSGDPAINTAAEANHSLNQADCSLTGTDPHTGQGLHLVGVYVIIGTHAAIKPGEGGPV